MGEGLMLGIKTWADAGYRPFPVSVFATPAGSREKKPLVPWAAYQTRQPSPHEIASWATIYPSAGVGVATGQGLVVIDIDSAVPLVSVDGTVAIERLVHFPWFTDELLIMAVRTGGGGLHLWCRSDTPVRNATNIYGIDKTGSNVVVDIRGDGGYVVVPPTQVYAGEKSTQAIGAYTLIGKQLGLQELPLFPDLGAPSNPTRAKERAIDKLDPLSKVGEGSRHDRARDIAMSLVNSAKTFEGLKMSRYMFRELLERAFKTEGFEVESKEVSDLFESAARKVVKERGPEWAILQPAMRKAKKTAQVMEDLEEWPFKVLKATHVGDMLQLTVLVLDRESTVMLRSADWQVQPKFRAAFFQATSLTLPAIRNKSFEAFIQTVEFTRQEGFGTSIAEDLLETLRAKAAGTRFKDGEGEHVEELRRRNFGRQGHTLYFRLNGLCQEPAMKVWSKSTIVLALENMRLESEDLEGVGRVWKWKIDNLK